MGRKASTVLPPFSGELRADEGLKLSHDDFIQLIEMFYANKQLSAIDQLKVTPPYPTPCMLAQFASMAYRDCRHGDPKPPEGWQLLTKASNFRTTNGYFGTAYWHPEHQQVVIAHRGTDIKNVGALVTDVKGVLFNNYVEQMSSAITFANKVVTVLQEIEQQKKVSFELFFTGHSLGGWLAQITAFTTEYLEVKGSTFLKKDEPLASSSLQKSHDVPKFSMSNLINYTIKFLIGILGKFLKKEKRELPIRSVQGSHNVTQSYHPHAIVFDSPGCKDMLSQMADKLDVRHKERSIDLEHLDITSYLSAPNRINTCNSHLGTVYRIFTDLSGMGFFEQNTPLYNMATHSMDKIKQAFDSETGQVRKDDKGRLKIQEVVDWPVSARLTGGTELNDFFKWAEHLNNYHPEVKAISCNKVPKGYHPLRYQTKACDKGTKSLRVFTEEEREFLQRYRWLREVPEFFKPEDLFGVTSNAEAEKGAPQHVLQNFELDNESVRCPDASTLHALIPYVKRLVRLFPQVTEKVKEKLSSSQIRKEFYQNETQHYVKKIHQSALDFKSDALGLRKFLVSEQQNLQLRMTDGDAWTGITEVCQVLKNTSCSSDYNGEGNYTILKLGRLLTANRMINLNALLEEMENPHLLMIACWTNQTGTGELQNMFQELFKILKKKKTLKIILTAHSEDDIAAFIVDIATDKLGEGFITTDEQLTWSDLTASSQIAILEKTVIFQGRPVALNQLISAESMTDSFPLADLLQEKELTIGIQPVLSASSGYNEKFYIERTFNHSIFIRQDILSDERERKFDDLLASNEQEFEQLCQQNPEKSVHWLVKDKSGELIWLQSRGNLQTLRKYIDVHKAHCYAPSDLEKLLEQAKYHRVMIIADTAGMGKTTVLTHLSERIKDKYLTHWLVRIDINNYAHLLRGQKGKEMDKRWVHEFLSKEVLKLESQLEKELIKNFFEQNEFKKVIVMVDGFDEISPDYKETVFNMLQVLGQTSLDQLWVSTRPHLRGELEDKLQQLSYTLQPFSEVEQVEFLKKFWLQNLNLEVKNAHRLQSYAEALIRKLAQSIRDKDKKLTGIPLQTHMLAEAFQKQLETFYLSEDSEPSLPEKLDLLGLYERFIERKCGITETQAKAVVANEQRDWYLQGVHRHHELLALETLFPGHQLTFLRSDDDPTFSYEQLARIGIAQRNSEGKLQFIHRTFAEFYVAEFLIKRLTKKTKQSPHAQELLLNEILLRRDCHVIRVFLDGLLEKSKPSDEVLKEVGETLDEKWEERKEQGTLEGVTTALHEAAKEDNVHIIGFLLDSLKSGEHLRTVKKMLLHKDLWGQTAWHKAAENDSVQALTAIWEWAEGVTNLQEEAKRDQSDASDTNCVPVEEEELSKEKMFLAKDQYGNTAWHGAAQSGSLKAFETLWNWAKEGQLNPDQLLLDQGKNGNTAWQLAAQTGHLQLLQKLGDWAEDAKVNPTELKNKLLLAKDQYGYTVWHRAAESGSLEALETLWNLGTVSEIKPDEMFLDPGKDGNIAWLMAAQRGHFEVLKKLWEWANGEQMNGYVLNDKGKDQSGCTAWHRAAERGSLKSLETLWNWAKEAELNQDELKKEFFKARDKQEETTRLSAAKIDHIEVLEKLWVWSKEAQKYPNDLKRGLLLAKDQYGYTVWHRAAQRGSLVELETLWRWANEIQPNPNELENNFVLVENE